MGTKKKIRLNELHRFIVGPLTQELLASYKRFEIVNEAGLNEVVARELKKFIANDSEKGRLEVRSGLFCKASRTFPDILILKRRKPWIVIELKERGDIKDVTVFEEGNKIKRLRQIENVMRGYVLYLGRWGKHRRIRPKGEFGRWFYEVPVTLERAKMESKDIEDFEKEFRNRSKYRIAHA